MSKTSPKTVLAICAVALAAAVVVMALTSHPVLGRSNEEAQPPGTPHYSVVMTEGHNLLVTDNATNKLLFYTTDKDAPLGSPLKLRASLDLTKVGQDEIKITPHNLEKFEPKKK
jgi:hypothetical protein